MIINTPKKHYFLKRLIRNFIVGLAIGCLSLYLGMEGYHYYEKMSWTDAYVNAAMILSGMGPVQELKTEGGKIFAGTYALFSGIVFLFVMAIIFAPIVHYFFNKWRIPE